MAEIPEPTKYWAVGNIKGSVVDSSINQAELQNVVNEATDLLAHPNPLEHHRMKERVHSLGMAICMGTFLTLDAWMFTRGHNSIYDQVVAGFKQMGQ